MNNKIIEASQLPEKDELFLKKDMFGWRVVNPIKDKDGVINPINLLFGGYRNLVMLVIILCIAMLVLFSYNHDVTNIEAHYKEISENPIAFCQNFHAGNTADGTTRYGDINFSELLGGENASG